MRMLPLICSVAVAFATTARAQELVPKIEYQSGHAGLEKKAKGSLVIGASEVRFVDEKGRPLIVMPVSQITDVSSSVERKDASLGAKVALGFLSKSRRDELLTVSYETGTTAEAVVLKTEQNASAGIVAKIRYQMKQAGIKQADKANQPPQTLPTQPIPSSSPRP